MKINENDNGNIDKDQAQCRNQKIEKEGTSQSEQIGLSNTEEDILTETVKKTKEKDVEKKSAKGNRSIAKDAEGAQFHTDSLGVNDAHPNSLGETDTDSLCQTDAHTNSFGQTDANSLGQTDAHTKSFSLVSAHANSFSQTDTQVRPKPGAVISTEGAV